MAHRWESCTKLLYLKGRGLVRCWMPAATGANGLCAAHERERVTEEEFRAIARPIRAIRQAVAGLQHEIAAASAETGHSEPAAPRGEDALSAVSRSFVVTMMIDVPRTTPRESVQHTVSALVQGLGSWTGRVVAVEEVRRRARPSGDPRDPNDHAREGDQQAS